MEIYKDKYVHFDYDKEKSLMTYVWKKETEKMSDKEYKNIILKLLDFLIKYPSKRLLANQLQKKNIVTPDLQKWISEVAGKKIFKTKILKYAILESKDVVINISSEQILDEVKSKDYGVKFFDNEQKAMDWLLNK